MRKRLPVHRRAQERPYWCLAACIQMATEVVRPPAAQCQIVGNILGLSTSCCVTPVPSICEILEFSPDEVPQVLRASGLNCTTLVAAHGSLSDDAVRRAIDANHPIICMWEYASQNVSHTVVVAGYDTEYQLGLTAIVYNPATRSPNALWLTMENLNSAEDWGVLTDAWEVWAS